MSSYFSPEALQTVACVMLAALAIVWAIPPDAKDTPGVLLFASRWAKRLFKLVVKVTFGFLILVTVAVALMGLAPVVILFLTVYTILYIFGAVK